MNEHGKSRSQAELEFLYEGNGERRDGEIDDVRTNSPEDLGYGDVAMTPGARVENPAGGAGLHLVGPCKFFVEYGDGGGHVTTRVIFGEVEWYTGIGKHQAAARGFALAGPFDTWSQAHGEALEIERLEADLRELGVEMGDITMVVKWGRDEGMVKDLRAQIADCRLQKAERVDGTDGKGSQSADCRFQNGECGGGRKETINHGIHGAHGNGKSGEQACVIKS